MKSISPFLLAIGFMMTALSAQAQLVPGPPSPKPPNPPPYYGACLYGVCEGETVFNIQRDYRKAVVVGIEPQGTYVLRFLDTGGVGGNWNRSALAVTRGCYGKTCVGDHVFNIRRNYRMVQVVGLQYNGQFVVRFLDTNGVGGNWTELDLAKPYGCGWYFCVGQYALNNKKNYRKVQIIGIEYYGTYVLRFLDTGGIGGNWTDSDLVLAPNP